MFLKQSNMEGYKRSGTLWLIKLRSRHPSTAEKDMPGIIIIIP